MARVSKEHMGPDEVLLQRIKARLPELEELHKEVTSHREEEDAVYRYYHGSFKVYSIQDCTNEIVALFQELGDGLWIQSDRIAFSISLASTAGELTNV